MPGAEDNYPQNASMLAEPEVLAAQLVGGGNGSEAVDISASDHPATMTNCRFIQCTSGTVIKVDYLLDDESATITEILPAELRIIPQRNITKVYKTGTDATNIYLKR